MRDANNKTIRKGDHCWMKGKYHVLVVTKPIYNGILGYVYVKLPNGITTGPVYGDELLKLPKNKARREQVIFLLKLEGLK